MFDVPLYHLNIEEIKTMMTINTPTRAELRHKGIIKLNEPRKQRTAGEVESSSYQFILLLLNLKANNDRRSAT